MIRPVNVSPALDRSRQCLAAQCDGPHVPLTCTRMTASKSSEAMFQMAPSRTMPGVVDEDVELAPRVGGLGDHAPGALVVGDVLVVGDGLAAPRLDDLDREVGVLRRALAAHRAAEVVDHDLGAVAGQLHGVPAADAVARAGDDGDLAVEKAHGSPSIRAI